MMSLRQVRRRLQDVARNLKLHKPEIHVEKPGKWIHILIAAPDFKGMSASERENVVWRELEHQLDDETILSITQCYLMTPKERSAAMPEPLTAAVRDQ